jgi:MFS family permease
MALNRYRDVLAAPGIKRLFVTSLIARAPQGMSSLSILLLVSRGHGYAKAGLVVGLYVAGTGAAAPVLGRLVDRIGARVILRVTAVAYGLMMSVLAASEHAAYPVLAALAALAGASSPPVIAVVRGMWARRLGAEQAQQLYALEATAQELTFIVGPTLVAVLAGLFDPRAAVAVTATLGAVGTAVLSTSPAFDVRPAASARVKHRLLRTTPLLLFVVTGFTLTVGFNMCDIAVIAFVSGRTANAVAGLVLAVWSLGSMFGGLLFGGRGGAVTDRTLAQGCLAIGAGMALAAVAPGRIGLALILFGGGMVVAPGLARLYTRVGAIAPEAASTEAFAWIGVGFLAGSALGSALGGWSVDEIGARATFLIAGIPPALPVALLFARGLRRRRSLAAAAQPLAS